MRREYPEAPLVGVGGIVIERGRVLLARRLHPPQRGEWSIPGGALHVGETLAHGAAREVREETGLRVEPVALVEVLDRIVRDPRPGASGHAGGSGRVRYHYVLIDFLCHRVSGRLRPGSDAGELRWVSLEEIQSSGQLAIAPFTSAVIEKAFRIEQGLHRPRDGSPGNTSGEPALELPKRVR